MMSQQRQHQRGFTLIELLIVIVVIAILALIVIPRLMGAARKARESTLKGNLAQLRSAISAFQGDTGFYPATLSELVQTDGLDGTYGAGGAETDNVKAAYKGPYLTPSGGLTTVPGIPYNPFTAPAEKNDVEKNWTYTAADGLVKSTVTGTTLDGESFVTL